MSHEKIEKTLEHIKEAFIDLLYEKGFHAMTVSDITRKAKINRGTFYNHYLDKYDLLETYENEILTQINEVMIKGVVIALQAIKQNKEELLPYDVALEATKMIYQERRLIVALVSDKGDPAFIGLVKEAFAKQMRVAIEQNGSSNKYSRSIPKKYADELIFSSLVSVILFWLTTGQKETPEEIANILTAIQFTMEFKSLQG